MGEHHRLPLFFFLVTLSFPTPVRATQGTWGGPHRYWPTVHRWHQCSGTDQRLEVHSDGESSRGEDSDKDDTNFRRPGLDSGRLTVPRLCTGSYTVCRWQLFCCRISTVRLPSSGKVFLSRTYDPGNEDSVDMPPQSHRVVERQRVRRVSKVKENLDVTLNRKVVSPNLPKGSHRFGMVVLQEDPLGTLLNRVFV